MKYKVDAGGDIPRLVKASSSRSALRQIGYRPTAEGKLTQKSEKRWEYEIDGSVVDIEGVADE